jgi:hypothetical protein
LVLLFKQLQQSVWDFMTITSFWFVLFRSCNIVVMFWNSVIDFECVDQTGIGTPVWITSTDPCVLRFSWKTSLACRMCIESDWQESVPNYIINLQFQL